MITESTQYKQLIHAYQNDNKFYHTAADMLSEKLSLQHYVSQYKSIQKAILHN